MTILCSLEAERKRKKELMKNVIVSAELKSIFERKFVCFMCDKSLSRHKLKGRCNHLKKCAKNSGKDVYSVCALVGIQRDIIDNPKKYEKKFEEHYYRDKKRINHGCKRKKNQNDDVDVELDDFDAFKFDNSPHKTQMLVKNDGSKARIKNIENELDGLMKRGKKKKRIAVNNYDEHIQDIMADLSQIGAMTQKLNAVRQHLEVKLQRAQALKKQHGMFYGIHLFAFYKICLEDTVRAAQESILQSVSPSKPAKEDEIDFKTQPIDNVVEENGFLDFNVGACSNEGKNHNTAENMFDSSMNSSQRASADPIQFRKSSVDEYNKELLASQRPQKIKKRKNIWNVAQEAHKSTPSQFKLSSVLPKCRDSILESPAKSQRSESTQMLLDRLDNEQNDSNDDDDNDCDTNGLMTSFFNEGNSCVPGINQNKMEVDDIGNLNDCGFDEEIECVSSPQSSQKSNIFLSEQNKNNNDKFVDDESLSLSSENALNKHNGNGSVNNNSLHSNNGSLFEVEVDQAIDNNVDIDTFGLLANENGDDYPLNISMTMSPMQMSEKNDISNFGDFQNEITPISNRHNKKVYIASTNRLCLV